MFCNSSTKNLSGLSRFNKEKVIKVCEHTIKTIKQSERKDRNKELRKVAYRLKDNSTGFWKYLPWNWWIKEINIKVCRKQHSIECQTGILPDCSFYLYKWGYFEMKAKEVLKVCKNSDSNSIYLDGNDVAKLFWPKEESENVEMS